MNTNMPDPRTHLLRALEADLIGPCTLDPAAVETLPLAPTRWYLTGFLAPQHAQPQGAELEEEELDGGADEDDPDAGPPDRAPKGPRVFAASIGLSVLLPPAQGEDVVHVTLSYADYVAVAPPKAAASADAKALPPSKGRRFARAPRAPLTTTLALDAESLERGREVAPGLWLEGRLAGAIAPGLPPGTRALSMFVVNRRRVDAVRPFDESCIFQVGLELQHPTGLVARPNRRDERSTDEDEKVADLQFRDCSEWAVGHGVSVEALAADGQKGRVTGARTVWLPRQEVKRVDTLDLSDVTTSMDALAEPLSGAELKARLSPLMEHYGAWIAAQRRVAMGASGAAVSPEREETREMLLHRAEEARQRIAAGIALLERDAEVREAFRLANRAMAQAARQRNPERYTERPPAWRLFQLAFVLLNLESLANPASEDRHTVELLFFPTGGGKTEAYLGIIAFGLVLRRLRGIGRADAGLGVAVLLRYTLRLLTLDQLGRAATLICALELLRREQPERLGQERFSIGLWVGRSATPNTMQQAVDEIRHYKAARGPSPFPLPSCPWCRAPLGPQSLTTEPSRKPERVIVGCLNDCPFATGNDPDASAENPGAQGIPVLFVDDQIYRELPCFIVATVDKLAMLPWRGRTGALFGRVHSRLGRELFGVMDSAAPKKGSKALPTGLLPPDLIVQDELHLIAGPLGTMVGLYETAIEELSTRELDGRRVVPKILASTATVRRAHQQVRSLFGRASMQVFPPAGVDDSETFFAHVDAESPGRLYVGVAAPGRALKAVLIRTYIALLGAAQHLFERADTPRKQADAYMTLVGYFNSIRELGGMRRLLEDEIRVRVDKDQRERTPLELEGPHPWLARRRIKYEPVELTSRESTAKIAEAKRQLETSHPAEGLIDVALASNMISVGLDIDRLGLMVIAGQPKTTSEYIQSSSRVGRDVKRPGLVVTVFNLYRPRDRSHYERFAAYHQCFYRFVEATSVTPFSAPALDRGLAGVLVTLIRLAHPELTPSDAVQHIDQVRSHALAAISLVASKAANEEEGRTTEETARVSEAIQRIGQNLLDAWALAVSDDPEGGVSCYSSFEERKGAALLFTSLDVDAPNPTSPRAKFAAGTSMRDVEPSVHLWKSKKQLTPMEQDDGI
jgi:hypothetical protein